MKCAERRGNKVVATAAKSTRRSRRSYTIRTGHKPTSNRRRKKQEKLPRGVRKITLQERRAKRAEANGKSNKTKNNTKGNGEKQTHQQQVGKTCRPCGSTYYWVSDLLVESHGHSLKNITQTHFYLCSLHIGIRQGAAELELGDLEAVASLRGSPQLGGQLPILHAVRFLYGVSTGDYSEIIGPGWHLSSPGQT